MNFNNYFKYNNGLLYWSVKKQGVKQGVPVGSMNGCGYLITMVEGKRFYVHRIIWEMHNGKIPEGMEIDHINHIRNDNRLENLRLVTHKKNGRNTTKTSRNKSGVVGVCKCIQTGKWKAYIIINGKFNYLGRFEIFEDAVKARKNAELSNEFHENHGK